MSRMYFVKKRQLIDNRCYFIAPCYNNIISKLFYRHQELVKHFKTPLVVSIESTLLRKQYVQFIPKPTRDYLPIHRGSDLLIYEVTGSIDILCNVKLKTSYMLNNRFRIIPAWEILCFVVIVKFVTFETLSGCTKK